MSYAVAGVELQASMFARDGTSTTVAEIAIMARRLTVRQGVAEQETS